MYNPVVRRSTVAMVLGGEVALLLLGSWLWLGMPGWRQNDSAPTITIHMKVKPGSLGRTYSL